MNYSTVHHRINYPPTGQRAETNAGVHPSRARKTPFVLGMGLSTLLVFANFVDTNTAVIALMAMVFFGKGFAAVGWAVLSDVAPKTMIGLCGGVTKKTPPGNRRRQD